ncbi:MAG: 50S ribosomal protein L33 [Metamycoplasmataceae bacterium]
MKKKVALACQNCKIKNYYTNKSNDDRIVINKFCNNCRAHHEHKEEK